MEVNCGVMQYSTGVWKKQNRCLSGEEEARSQRKQRKTTVCWEALKEWSRKGSHCCQLLLSPQLSSFLRVQRELISFVSWSTRFFFFVFWSDYSGWEYNVIAEGQISTNVHSKKWQLLLKSLIVVLRYCFCPDKCAETIMEVIIHAFQFHKDGWTSLSCFLQEWLRLSTSK